MSDRQVSTPVWLDFDRLSRTQPEHDWVKRAACAKISRDLFFPGQGENEKIAEAKAICHRCPVTYECLVTQLEAAKGVADHGVWGGTTPVERRRIRKMLREWLAAQRASM